jgi:hypothetical protein
MPFSKDAPMSGKKEIMFFWYQHLSPSTSISIKNTYHFSTDRRKKGIYVMPIF